MDLRDYFAGRAMNTVTSEMQEVRPASFWDWVKMLLQIVLHFTWLEVRYVKIEGIDKEIAKKSYELADAMLAERNKK